MTLRTEIHICRTEGKEKCQGPEHENYQHKFIIYFDFTNKKVVHINISLIHPLKSLYKQWSSRCQELSGTNTAPLKEPRFLGQTANSRSGAGNVPDEPGTLSCARQQRIYPKKKKKKFRLMSKLLGNQPEHIHIS